jgi:prevent-host-death family protein
VKQKNVTITELKTHLGTYLGHVKMGSTLVLTERGKPIGRIVPIKPTVEAQMQELRRTGLVAWSGRKLNPIDPVAQTRGAQTVADLLLEDRE